MKPAPGRDTVAADRGDRGSRPHDVQAHQALRRRVRPGPGRLHRRRPAGDGACPRRPMRLPGQRPSTPRYTRLQVTPTAPPSSAPAAPSRPAAKPSAAAPHETCAGQPARGQGSRRPGPQLRAVLHREPAHRQLRRPARLRRGHAGRRGGTVPRGQDLQRQPGVDLREPRATDSEGFHLYWIRNVDDGFLYRSSGHGRGGVEHPAQRDRVLWTGTTSTSGWNRRSSRTGWQYYWLRNTVTNMCLDVPGAGTGGTGVQLALVPCLSGDDHEWALVEESEW